MKTECTSLGMSDDRFNQLVQEIAETERIDNTTTDMIDKNETIKEICGSVEYVNVEILYDTIIHLATTHERIAKKFYHYEISAIKNGDDGHLFNSSAQDYEKFAKELRNLMTQIIRMQKSENRIINLNKQI